MEGVQILNTYIHYDIAAICVSAVIVAICVVCMIPCWIDKDPSIIALIILAFIFGYFGIYCESNGHVRYEAYVDQSASYFEFTEKYELIEQRGNIFVLEEKFPKE